MHWILQNNLFNESAYQVLLDTLIRFEIPHSIHKVIPFIGELTPEVQLTTNNVICMGSYSLRHSAKKFGWNPGVFDLEPFHFKEQLSHWGFHMLNHDSIVDQFQNIHYVGDRFIRPIHDSKVFAGQIMNGCDFEDWRIKVCELGHDYGDSLSGETLIQVCNLKKIHAEYRFWVVKGKIITASMYKIGTTIHYQEWQSDSDVWRFAEDRIAEWQPHEAFVIDVAETPEGMKVVEINTLNSCGFYAANIQKLVMALEESFSE